MKWKKVIIIALIVLLAGAGIYFLASNFFSGDNGADMQGSLPIKVSIKKGGEFNRELQITNNKNYQRHFDIYFEKLEGIAFLNTDALDLDSGQTASINFSLSDKNNMEGGIYTGSLIILSEDKGQKKPIVVELESEDVLFDSSVEMYPIGNAKPGDSINPRVKIYDLSNIGTAKVKADYVIKDFSGNDYYFETEDIIVKDKVEFTKNVYIPETIPEGNYIFAVIVEYKNSVGVASAIFTAAEESEGFLNENMLYMLAFLGFILLIFLLFVFYSIYSRDKLFDELRSQYQSEIRRQRGFIKCREKEVEKKLETRQERRFSRRIFKKVKKQREKIIKIIHKERVKKLKVLKKQKKRNQMQTQINKWKKQGYDVSALGKQKIPTLNDIKKQINKWKKRGYDTTALKVIQ